MKDCKHELVEVINEGNYAIKTKSIKQYFRCLNCNENILPTWTVKPEPIKLEFDAELHDFVMPEYGNTINFKPTELSSDSIVRELGSGKRFKITAEEITE